MPEDANEVLQKLRELLGRPDPVSFTRAGVSPGAIHYLTREERLYIRSRCSVASVSITLAGRVHQPGGRIAEFTHTHTPNSDRTVALARFDLGEGYLLGLAVHVSSGAVRRGQCFVECGLLRGLTQAASVRQVLVKDYVTLDDALGWPGGEIRSSLDGAGMLRSITGTDPAAGVEISEAVPTDARWRVHSFRAQLVTAVAAATRRVHLVVDDGATTLLELAAADTQIASLTRNYNAAADGFARAAADSEIYIPLPTRPELLQASRIATSTTLLQAADDWGAPQLEVEEWIEE